MKNPLRNSLRQLSLVTLLASLFFIDSGCEWSTPAQAAEKKPMAAAASSAVSASVTIKADAAGILARTQVPILCYHQLRDWTASDSRTARAYIVPVNTFKEQMQSLADSGYHTILPDELYDYLVQGKALPSKPVMITFDDTRINQYTLALPELSKHDFKGVYFVMTVSLGRPGYMSREQVKQLADEGNTIGSHTWNHDNVKKYTEDDWKKQVDKATSQLQEITGKSIDYFAYPFGLWNKDAIAHLKQRGFKGVFQLSEKMDPVDPLFSIRRIIVPGSWTPASLQKAMKNSFSRKGE